jgi:hypothetical protein
MTLTPPPERPLGLLASVATWGAALLPMAPLGTLAHETGHWLVARALGCPATLHFARTSTHCPATWEGLVALGGPAQTLLTGTLGVVGLLWLRDRPFGRAHLPWLFLGLFWSRQVFNAAAWTVFWVFELAPPTQLAQGDAFRIAAWLGLPSTAWLYGTALLGLLALAWMLRLLPRSQQVPFAVGGGTGSLLGYALWMQVLGPVLLP